MKTKSFYDLSEEQQERAVAQARAILMDVIDLEIVEVEGDELLEDEIEKLSLMAAEGSQYTQDGTPLVGDPSFYSGCI